MKFKEVTEERYYDMLGVLPPACMMGYGFLVGEALSHRNGEPVFAPYVRQGEKYFEGKYENYNGLTIAQFKAFKFAEHEFPA